MTTCPKIALVTGANKGIGLEICRQLAQAGITVLLGSRDLARGRTAAASLQGLGGQVLAIQVDMGTPATFAAVAERIAAEHGRLDILVNNAGIALDWDYQADTVPVALVRETFETNLFAVVDLTQRLLPLLRRSPAGRIVNHSSILGSLALRTQPDSWMAGIQAFAYDASKTALNAYTVHLAQVLKGTPVKVNSAHPGNVKTDMNPGGDLSVETGARTAVQLATLPDDGPTGGFFHLGDPLPW